LLSLPTYPFEIATWRVAKVQLNYHIAVDKMNYSVPFEYIGRPVDVRLTKNMVEVLSGGNRIASHVRKYGVPGQYSTIVEHMPERHQQYTKWNAERFESWGRSIGVNTEAVVRAILSSRVVEQHKQRTGEERTE
jgi:hypothetical protein